jgi:hypothetical protein
MFLSNWLRMASIGTGITETKSAEPGWKVGLGTVISRIRISQFWQRIQESNSVPKSQEIRTTASTITIRKISF